MDNDPDLADTLADLGRPLLVKLRDVVEGINPDADADYHAGELLEVVREHLSYFGLDLGEEWGPEGPGHQFDEDDRAALAALNASHPG